MDSAQLSTDVCGGYLAPPLAPLGKNTEAADSEIKYTEKLTKWPRTEVIV